MNDAATQVTQGSLATLDYFQCEGVSFLSDPRPIVGRQFIRSGIEQMLDSWLRHKEWRDRNPETLHELAFWGIAPKSCLGKHYM